MVVSYKVVTFQLCLLVYDTHEVVRYIYHKPKLLDL